MFKIFLEKKNIIKEVIKLYKSDFWDLIHVI